MENNFIKPQTLKETLEVLNEGNSMIIAGGTDVLVAFHEGKKTDKTLIDISGLEELKNIEKLEDTIIIGACSTHSEIEKSSIVKDELPMLSKGCSLVGSTLIRNRATIGGNIVNNSSCADSVPPLMILEGEVVLESVQGVRTLPLKDFFLNRGKLDLKENELLKEIKVRPMKGYNFDLVKVGRRKSLAISRLTLAIALKKNNDIIEDLRICPGAMLPRHGRLNGTEEEFRGKVFNEETIEAIANSAVEEAIGLSGRRWSTEYKEPVLKGLIIRTLEQWR